ncbi:hypothetical protein [Kitasatospora sp. NPDC088346]|uniref:hypothetical protein n=1 Tax=Kitasatospora sp. NPDC088346 TaxID=3364073 RepID=UPI00382310AE
MPVRATVRLRDSDGFHLTVADEHRTGDVRTAFEHYGSGTHKEVIKAEAPEAPAQGPLSALTGGAMPSCCHDR